MASPLLVSAFRQRGRTRQYSTFYIEDQFFGIEVLKVQEVLQYLEMTPVPMAPEVIRGLINLRGQIVTAVYACADAPWHEGAPNRRAPDERDRSIGRRRYQPAGRPDRRRARSSGGQFRRCAPGQHAPGSSARHDRGRLQAGRSDCR